ncbi:MAG: hypothetical protein WCG49_01525 [Actinomycetes bacterium]|jgi:hypothetical protein
MHETSLADVSGKWVIAAVTRDYCDVWHVVQGPEREVMHLHRPDEGAEHHHVRQAQEHHGHRSDAGSSEYYKYVAAVLAAASEIMLVGHGSGKSSIVEEFAEYFSKHLPNEYKLVTEIRHVNLPALSGGELIQLAHGWKKEQMEFGV